MMTTKRGVNPSKDQEITNQEIPDIVTIETIEVVGMIEIIVIATSIEMIEIVEMIRLTVEDGMAIETIEIIVNIEIKDIIAIVGKNQIAESTGITVITVNDIDPQIDHVRKNMPVHKKEYAEVSPRKVLIERYPNDRQTCPLIRSLKFLPVKPSSQYSRPWKAVVILQSLLEHCVLNFSKSFCEHFPFKSTIKGRIKSFGY
jgi:hypothetical protein